MMVSPTRHSRLISPPWRARSSAPRLAGRRTWNTPSWPGRSLRTTFHADPRRRSIATAPGPGAVAIERLRGSAWKVVRRLRPGHDGVFQVRLPASRGALLRARQGGEMSLEWRVGETIMILYL